jgi:hypothetical protein
MKAIDMTEHAVPCLQSLPAPFRLDEKQAPPGEANRQGGSVMMGGAMAQAPLPLELACNFLLQASPCKQSPLLRLSRHRDLLSRRSDLHQKTGKAHVCREFASGQPFKLSALKTWTSPSTSNASNFFWSPFRPRSLPGLTLAGAAIYRSAPIQDCPPEQPRVGRSLSTTFYFSARLVASPQLCQHV